MSDFGVLLKFSKNNVSLNGDDLLIISTALKNIVTNGNYPSNITDGNYLPLKLWENGVYVSVITEYYLGENEKELRQLAQEEDLSNAEAIIYDLKNILDIDINMSAQIEDW